MHALSLLSLLFHSLVYYDHYTLPKNWTGLDCMTIITELSVAGTLYHSYVLISLQLSFFTFSFCLIYFYLFILFTNTRVIQKFCNILVVHASLQCIHHMTEAVQASIVVVGALTYCTSLHSMCDL